MAKIGYARVSTKDQNLDLQLAELEKAGCEKVYSEHKSGLKARLELAEAIKYPLLVISGTSLMLGLFLVGISGILILSENDDEDNDIWIMGEFMNSAWKVFEKETWKWNHKR